MGKSATTEKPKRQVTKGYTKIGKITYKLFYAIRYAIDLECDSKAIVALFNIGESTFYRIRSCKTYAEYKALTNASYIDTKDGMPPVTPADLAAAKQRGVDATLANAVRVLTLAQNIKPAKRSWFGGRR